MIGPEDVIAFWLGAPGSPPLANSKKWFTKDDAFDAEIRARFGDAIHAAARGQLDGWKSTPRGRLGFVVLCDQLSRNAFRGTPRAFAQDALAVEAAAQAMAAGDDASLTPMEQQFLRMPFMHAEDVALQHRAVADFERLLAEAPAEIAGYAAEAVKYSKMHAAIVERFGRFPHRNAILGRDATPEEIEFLKQPGSAF